ncbi:MAG TPA: hypothetical protein VHU81_19090 [Thermoanaerobaculia bacterium]|jgi:hypothetical protein|nr:hypothetical protein [Thermoanaerobaculia bacterium]
MRLNRLKAAALLAALSLVMVSAEASAAKTVKELSRNAEFVFRGTILKPAAANLEIVEPNEKTAVVRVDEILKGADTLGDFTGREITVFLQGRPLKAGQQRVFFSTVGLMGETLGVQEVGRLTGRAADAKAKVTAAELQVAEEALASRLKAADLAIKGRVLNRRATYDPAKPEVISEHDPQWWEAVFEVTAVIQGNLVERTLPVWFPSSRDAMWAAVPKPDVGQEGTWLLHRYQTESGRVIFALLDAQDQLSDGETKMLEKMVKP